MNPQYLQQQSPYYGVQSPNSPYNEPNANTPSNAQTLPSSLYENNTQHGPPQSTGAPPQPYQKSLIDQMSNVTLSNSQKSVQGFPTQPEKNITSLPSSVNGVNNQNHCPPQKELQASNLIKENAGNTPLQQGPPNSQSSNLPFAYGSSGTPEFGGQNISKNIPQSSLLNQSQIGQTISNQNRPVLPHQTGTIPSIQGQPQQNMTNPIPGQLQGTLSNQLPIGRPPLPGQSSVIPSSLTHQNLPGQTTTAQNLQSSSMPSSLQNMSRPPLIGQSNNLVGPPLPGQQNLAGPPFGVPPNAPNLSGPPLMAQQSFSRPPLPGQQKLLGPPIPGQPNLQTQTVYSNQAQGQQQYSSHSLPGQQSGPPYGMNQGFQQSNYGSGQPPMYGNQASPYQGGIPSGPGRYQGNAQTQQSKSVDPEHMPSPINVFQDDQNLRGGSFITNQKGQVPPLVTTNFIVQDQGNASPRFIRSSIYSVPTSADMIKQTQIPFGILLSPIAQLEEGEYEPPIVDMGEIGPVRCVRCKAYMSPFMQFIDAGRRFQCMFCKATTEVPQEYFQHLDHTGQRMDRYERPELILGTFEYLATKEYCTGKVYPKPPAMIFVIDVSYNNVKSGLVQLLCSEIKKIIRNLPIDVGQSKSNMKVGFITYNNSVHFYNCKPNLAQPQMMFVGDVQDVFMPLLEGFLCDPEESESTIDSLMVQIPLMFGETRETETILGPAIQAGLEALKASECAGKLMIFHSSLPISEAPGKLKNRDDRNVLGTEKEKSILAPQTNFYNTLGQECVNAGCSVDLFLFNNSYIDVATIAQVSRLTGGEVYKYTYFQADVDGDRLITDIINNISKPIAFDAVMRVRTSTGVRPTDFYGHLNMSNTTDIELASIDCDKSIAIEIKHDDKLAEEEGVYIQAALLYTSCSGIRRLRIINLSLKTSSQMAELYRTCDLDVIINFLLKQNVSKLVELSSKGIKDGLNSRCASILAAYRKHCCASSNASQLVLPECLKLLPLYTNSLLKCDALTGGAGITVDQKSYVMMAVTSMSLAETVVYVYPRLIPLHNVDLQSTELPSMLRCSIDKFQDDGVYLLENGFQMFIWLGLSLNPQWVQAVFGVASVIQIDTDKCIIPVLDNSLNKRIRDIIDHVQSERRRCMRLTLTRQREKMEMMMRQLLVEDKGPDGSLNYVDYICHMYGEIRSLLS